MLPDSLATFSKRQILSADVGASPLEAQPTIWAIPHADLKILCNIPSSGIFRAVGGNLALALYLRFSPQPCSSDRDHRSGRVWIGNRAFGAMHGN